MAAGNPEISNAVGPMLAERTEYLNFLNNNHALTEGDKAEGEKVMNENMSPAQMQGSLKNQAHTAAQRLEETNKKYFDVFHKNAPGALSPTSSRSLQHFGLGSYAQRLAPANQAPAGASGEVHDGKTGQLLGHVVNGSFVPLQRPQ